MGAAWRPDPVPAELGGAALLLLAVVAALLVCRLGRPWLRPCLIMFWPMPIALVGLVSLLSGLLGTSIAPQQLVDASVATWAFLGPVAAVGLGVYSGPAGRRAWPLLTALGFTSPLLMMLTIPLLTNTGPHRSAPWGWTPEALVLIAAGVTTLIWDGRLPPRRTQRVRTEPRHRMPATCGTTM